MWGMGNNSNNNPNYNAHDSDMDMNIAAARAQMAQLAELEQQQQQQQQGFNVGSYPNLNSVNTATASDFYNSAAAASAFQQYQQVQDNNQYSNHSRNHSHHSHGGNHNHSRNDYNGDYNGGHNHNHTDYNGDYSGNHNHMSMGRAQQHSHVNVSGITAAAASNALLEERRRVEMALAANALQEEAQREVQQAQMRQAQVLTQYEREVVALAASEQLVGLRRTMMAQELAGAVSAAAANANDNNSSASGGAGGSGSINGSNGNDLDGMNMMNDNLGGGGGGRNGNGNINLEDYPNSLGQHQQQNLSMMDMDQDRDGMSTGRSHSQMDYIDMEEQMHGHRRDMNMMRRGRSNSMSDSIGSAHSRDNPFDGNMYGRAQGHGHSRGHGLSRGKNMMDSLADLPNDDDIRTPARSRTSNMEIGFGKAAESDDEDDLEDQEPVPMHMRSEISEMQMKIEPSTSSPLSRGQGQRQRSSTTSTKKGTKTPETISMAPPSPQIEDNPMDFPPTTSSSLGMQVPASPITSSAQSSSKKKKKSTPSSSNSNNTSSSSKKNSGSAKKTPAKRTPKKSVAVSLDSGSFPNINFNVPPITREEYANLDELMTQFCKVPLLAEFSRPVSLLHPELSSLYHKVVLNPIDLGKVCRAIRRRQYADTRQVCVDVWRIFSNCVKYHTHPITREGAIPSFVSIANHLREYFNALWMEYMLPSEINVSDRSKDPIMIAMKNAEEKRMKIRKDRLNGVLTIVLSSKLLERAVAAIGTFVDMGGRVDALDKESILNDNDEDENDEDSDENDEAQAVEAAFSALTQLTERLTSISNSDYEYTVEALAIDLRRCYSDEVFEGFPRIKVKFEKRLDRILGKLLVPVNEVSCRGVNQSSVWGCMAAAIWARETTKRPYWPALVLGIMAPEDQKEDWHDFLTVRNEERLPEKLQAGLQTGKKRAVQAIAKQNSGNAERMSYFLVEFLGTHEFIWVKEADIIENFDPDEDVNQQPGIGNITKKKKSSLRGHTAAHAKMLQKATDEGRWALEEFEMLLNDPCGDQMDLELEEEEEEENYTYPVLCESDDEADEADTGLSQESGKNANVFNSPTGVVPVVDEVNELIATDGKLDYTVEGRKTAKKRAAAIKKQKVAEAKKAAAKSKKEKVKKSRSTKEESKASKHESEMKKEQKELEKRRKKRGRERERVIKEEERKAKKNRTADGSSVVRRGRKLGIADKRGRATNIVRGYINRMAIKDGMKGLGLSGVTTLPAASVEGSGLLGLALAFRAAAGELQMPNNDDTPSNLNPWDRIDVNKPQKSEDRCKNLQKQIELLEKAMRKLDQDDERRRGLMEIANRERENRDKIILNAEKEARQNDMPKRKVSVKRKISIDKHDAVKKEADESMKNDDSAVKMEIMTDQGQDSDQEAVAIATESEIVDSEDVIPEIEAIQADNADAEEF